MKFRQCIYSIFFCLLLSSCSGGGGSSEGGGGCGALGAKVFGGETCDQNARSPVIALFPIAADGEQIVIAGICTGTLVTVDDILTSAHCFTEPLAQFGSQILGFVVLAGGADGEALFVTNAAVHPFYDGQAGSPFDVAMATLEKVPSPAIGPVPVLVSQASKSGQKASTFGYGTSNEGEVGVLKSAELTIAGFQGGNIFVDTADSGGASICQGDSGGPLVQVINGVASIIGVNSFGDVSQSQCAATGGNFSGFVDIQNELILDFISTYAPDVAVN